MRYETPAPPAELGEPDGLAYSLWLPDGDPWAGVVILHGAGSCKESHHDFARAARAAGLSAVCFDQRGHGATGGELDGRALDDVATVAALLGDVPLALRGSSMGGYLAILAAAALGAPGGGRRSARRAPTACGAACAAASSTSPPTSPRSRRSWPSTRSTAVEQLAAPLLLLHAEGDERVPVAHSRELARRFRDPHAELVVVPGGHHRSVQHDAELQGHALRWLRRAIGGGRAAAG